MNLVLNNEQLVINDRNLNLNQQNDILNSVENLNREYQNQNPLRKKTTSEINKNLTKKHSKVYHSEFIIQDDAHRREIIEKLNSLMVTKENLNDKTKLSIEIDYEYDENIKKRIDYAVSIVRLIQIIKQISNTILEQFKIYRNIYLNIPLIFKYEEEAFALYATEKQENTSKIQNCKATLVELNEKLTFRIHDNYENDLKKDIQVHNIIETGLKNKNIDIDELSGCYSEYKRQGSPRNPFEDYKNYEEHYKKCIKDIEEFENYYNELINEYNLNSDFLIQSKDGNVFSKYTSIETFNLLKNFTIICNDIAEMLILEIKELLLIEHKANYISNIRNCQEEVIMLQIQRLPLKDKEDEIKTELKHFKTEMNNAYSFLKSMVIQKKQAEVSKMQQKMLEMHEAQIKHLTEVCRNLQSQINECSSRINMLDSKLNRIEKEIETVDSITYFENEYERSFTVHTNRPFKDSSTLFGGKGLSTPKMRITNILEGPVYQNLKKETNIKLEQLGDMIDKETEIKENEFIVAKTNYLFYKEKVDYLVFLSTRIEFLVNRSLTEESYKKLTKNLIACKNNYIIECINFMLTCVTTDILENKISNIDEDLQSIFFHCRKNLSCCTCFVGSIHYLKDSKVTFKQLNNFAAYVVRKRLNIENSICTSVKERLLHSTLGDLIGMLKSKKLWVVLDEVCKFKTLEVYENRDQQGKLVSKSSRKVITEIYLNEITKFFLTSFIERVFKVEMMKYPKVQ